MLALKGDSSTPSTTLRTGIRASVPASVAVLGRLALCCGVAGNPGGDLGDCAAAGGAAEARGVVQGVGADGAEPVVAVGEAAPAVGGSGVAALAVGAGGAAFLTGGGGADDETLPWLPPPSSPMMMVSWVPRCCWSPALATQWVSSVV